MDNTNFLPEVLNRLIEELSKLPSVGHKSAIRLAFSILKKHKHEAINLSDALKNLHDNINYCQKCFNLCNESICKICNNTKKDDSIICVVEDVMDLIAIENSQNFSGKYHVLHGVLSPLKGIGINEIKIMELKDRIENDENIKELILATNTTTEGETTALFIRELLGDTDVKITRIASGMPFGGDLDYADRHTLTRALENRSLI